LVINWKKIETLYIEQEKTLSLRELKEQANVVLGIRVSHTVIAEHLNKEGWAIKRENYWNEKGFQTTLQNIPALEKKSKERTYAKKLDNLISDTFNTIKAGIDKIREQQSSESGMNIDPSKLRDLGTLLEGLTKIKKNTEENQNPLNPEKPNADEADKQYEKQAKHLADWFEKAINKSPETGIDGIPLDVDGSEGGIADLDSETLSGGTGSP